MKGMQAKGWLMRSPHPSDKRLAIFAMTDKGRSIFQSIFPDADALAREFSGLFSEEDAIQFRDMLDRAREHAAHLLDERDG